MHEDAAQPTKIQRYTSPGEGEDRYAREVYSAGRVGFCHDSAREGAFSGTQIYTAVLLAPRGSGALWVEASFLPFSERRGLPRLMPRMKVSRSGKRILWLPARPGD